MRVIIGNVQSPANPLLRAVSLLVGAVLLIGALFFGAIILAFVIGFVVIAGAVAAVRIWWIRRKLEKAAMGAQFRTSSRPQRNAAGGRVIEGEFADVSDTSQTRGEPRDRG
jgi:UPF0716 family protein affecting phage T7 exclusion